MASCFNKYDPVKFVYFGVCQSEMCIVKILALFTYDSIYNKMFSISSAEVWHAMNLWVGRDVCAHAKGK